MTEAVRTPALAGSARTSRRNTDSGVVPAGSTQTWKETQAVDLRLGNPSGVDLTINGKKESPDTSEPVTLSLGPAQKVQISPSPAGSAGLASGNDG